MYGDGEERKKNEQSEEAIVQDRGTRKRPLVSHPLDLGVAGVDRDRSSRDYFPG